MDRNFGFFQSLALSFFANNLSDKAKKRGKLYRLPLLEFFKILNQRGNKTLSVVWMFDAFGTRTESLILRSSVMAISVIFCPSLMNIVV